MKTNRNLQARAMFMAIMILFSALFSQWAVAIPLPNNSPDSQAMMLQHASMNMAMNMPMMMDMKNQGQGMNPSCHSMDAAMSSQTNDLPQMSYAHYCPYCHGPCHYNMDKCHVIYPVADLLTHQFSFELPSAKPVFSFQSALPVAPTTQEIRPPKFA